MAAGLLPDPLGELERSPRFPSRKTGGLLLREGEEREGKGIGWEGRGKEGRGKGREGKKGGKGKERGGGRGREMTPPLMQIPGSAPEIPCCGKIVRIRQPSGLQVTW